MACELLDERYKIKMTLISNFDKKITPCMSWVPYTSSITFPVFLFGAFKYSNTYTKVHMTTKVTTASVHTFHWNT